MLFRSSIDQIYQNALGRAPDQAGRDFWNQQMANGMSLQDIQNTVAHSQEALPRAFGTNPYTGIPWGTSNVNPDTGVITGQGRSPVPPVGGSMEPWKNQPQMGGMGPMGGMGRMGQMPYQTQSGAMGNLAGLLKLLPGMGGQQPQQGQGFGPAVNNFAQIGRAHV